MLTETQEILFSRIKIVNLQTKEEQNSQMLKMLKKGARDQIIYYLETTNSANDIFSEEEKVFLDI